MSRTRRSKSPHINLGYALAHKKHKDGKVRDGTPTHYSPSCRHHGGCAYCLRSRTHKFKRQEPPQENQK